MREQDVIVVGDDGPTFLKALKLPFAIEEDAEELQFVPAAEAFSPGGARPCAVKTNPTVTKVVVRGLFVGVSADDGKAAFELALRAARTAPPSSTSIGPASSASSSTPSIDANEDEDREVAIHVRCCWIRGKCLPLRESRATGSSTGEGVVCVQMRRRMDTTFVCWVQYLGYHGNDGRNTAEDYVPRLCPKIITDGKFLSDGLGSGD